MNFNDYKYEHIEVEKIKDEYLDEIIGREERDKRGNISPLFFIKAKK